MKRLRFSGNMAVNKFYLLSGLIALVVSCATMGLLKLGEDDAARTYKIEHVNATPAAQTVFTKNAEGEIVPLDFTAVAENVMDAVVHIKSTYTVNNGGRNYRYERAPNPFDEFFKNDPFRDFFNPRFFFREPDRGNLNQSPIRVGQGSGVIISDDGYIVTNNHVVADADDLEVTLYDNRTYKATIVGTDPTTDLAVVRIKEKNLPTIPFVDSDHVRVGEWVLAVGNPFNLNSTVTAGIVSAKGRNINILKDQFAVESFIQTDAAINPGNSGGALVNLQGSLIGIPTAIASPTGAYSGYGFAVPTNLVNKVVEDLIKYGVVQRGLLGVRIRTVDGALQSEKDLSVNTGAYVDTLLDNSAAEAAGIKAGDVITAVDGVPVTRSPELQEMIAQRRPGDVVTVTVDRNGKEKEFEVTLNNRHGNTDLASREHKEIQSVLGANLETLDRKLAKELDIPGGVRVIELYAGKLRKNTNMRDGFIITKVDGRRVTTVDELVEILEDKKGGVMLEGIYEDIPGAYYYAFGM